MSFEKPLEVKIDVDRCEIEKLKNIFEKEINSRRRLEEISDIQELIGVLENRNAVAPETWETLENRINSVRNISPIPKKVGVPKKLVKLINQSFESDWKDFGLHLKLTESQILKCHNLEEVLLIFEENCQGISEKELLFRLIRALDKSNKIDLKLEILQLLTNDSV